MFDATDYIIDELAMEGYSVENARMIRKDPMMSQLIGTDLLKRNNLNEIHTDIAFEGFKDLFKKPSGPKTIVPDIENEEWEDLGSTASIIPDATILKNTPTFDKYFKENYTPLTEKNFMDAKIAIVHYAASYGNLVKLSCRDIIGKGGNCFIMRGTQTATEKEPHVLSATRALFLHTCNLFPNMKKALGYTFYISLDRKKNYHFGFRPQWPHPDATDDYLDWYMRSFRLPKII